MTIPNALRSKSVLAVEQNLVTTTQQNLTLSFANDGWIQEAVGTKEMRLWDGI